jgi:two-component system sensor histidine kinase EvgS
MQRPFRGAGATVRPKGGTFDAREGGQFVQLRPVHLAKARMLSILVVEDHTPIRTAIVRSLERRGCRVMTATNGIEGLAAVRQQHFDAVITDLNMPERGGLWLWEEALAVRPELRGRFVLISSEARADERGMGLFLESEHFFVKPFSLKDLLRQVDEVAGGGSGSGGGDAPGDGRPGRAPS